jgi:hypothetical protein
MHWKFQNRPGYTMQTSPARGIGGMKLYGGVPYIVGEQVRVRRSIHAPLPGQHGRIIEVNMRDARAPYLLQFNNGLKFRYPFEELQRIHED